ncbi:MAG: MBL fold metallo-hydrolase, partial [Acidobacteria bacterium]|nr:MBL fold metallo-hydrolase [Acidobacteriota bacterium]
MLLRSLAVWLGISIPAAAQTVQFTWIGQSCYVVRTEGGPVVVTDPPAASTGYPLPRITADVVTVSHNHSDHNFTAGVSGEFALVDGRSITGLSRTTAAGMTFTLVPGFHDNQKGALRGANAIVAWTQSGIRFAHLGDYGEDEISEAQAAELRNIDVMFMPAGGFYTIDAARAARFVAQLKPQVAVLMHYRTALGGSAQLVVLPDVAEPFEPVMYKPSTVSLDRSRLPAGGEVWIMEPAADAAAVNAAGGLAGVPAPVLRASPARIDFQVPARQAPGQPLLEAKVARQRVARAPLTVVPAAPGLFGVLNEDGRVNSAVNPARRGRVIQIFGTGQGAVQPPVADGATAPAQPLSVSVLPPSVYLEGRLI